MFVKLLHLHFSLICMAQLFITTTEKKKTWILFRPGFDAEGALVNSSVPNDSVFFKMYTV